MKKIFSKIEPNILLHIICRKNDLDILNKAEDGRTDIAPENEFLQVAAMKMSEGQTFRPHKHIRIDRKTTITQESWVIINGSVKTILYDLDDTIIAEEILNIGDISITFRGGHNYKILENDTLVYEYKTGPYMGQKLDKTFIEND